MLHIGFPQALVMGLYVLSFAHTIKHDGEPRTDRHDAHAHGIGIMVMLCLLAWGRFFG